MKKDRISEESLNNSGCLMKIIEYNRANDIVVEFQDEYKAKVHTTYKSFSNGTVKNPLERIGEENYNNQGHLMRIIEYKNCMDIVVEFQDKHKAKICTRYDSFKSGAVSNPYHMSVCGVGMLGEKYSAGMNNKHTREYETWRSMLQRCYDKKHQEANPAYKNCTVCDEWLLFDNFYEWLHEQRNFDKWFNEPRWCVDKDIIVKNNKVYSPQTCCLVPQRVNGLFTKCDNRRGELPIGVCLNGNNFQAWCCNNITKQHIALGTYETKEDAFYAYKDYKENYIKQVAQEEFFANNITEECYNAMMAYEVEITD